jgi:hypothetical protein
VPNVTIDSVTTGDAAPTVAPHRISNKSGKDTATIKFTVINTRISAYMIRMGGSTAYTGTLLARKGFVCSESEPCSDTDPDKVCTDLNISSGTQVTETITYAKTGAPADGDQTVNVWGTGPATGGWG